MRIKIDAYNDNIVVIPFNYQYALRNAILRIILDSMGTHQVLASELGIKAKTGYEFIKDLQNQPRFSFSKLSFFPYSNNNHGFVNVRGIRFIFTAPIYSIQRHYIYNLFINKTLNLEFEGKVCGFNIKSINILPEKKMEDRGEFTCLSPIAVRPENKYQNKQLHYFDYTDSNEKGKFQEGIFKNLVKKYELLFQKPFVGDTGFEFEFDKYDILKRKGKISKLIHYGNNLNIKTFESHFYIKADPELIQVGYNWGFGYDNYNGLGCVETINNSE